jgi:hypothetical protein
VNPQDESSSFRLRRLGLAQRLGFSGLLLVLLGGLAASFQFIRVHHGPRDGKPGLTLDDVQGVYHGIQRTAPLVSALQRGHPEALPRDDREALLRWLGGSRVSEDYDSLDLGDDAPAELLQANCLGCHSRQATGGDGVGLSLPLDYWDDVQKVAFSTQVSPMSQEILLATTHTHALSMALIGIVVVLLGSWTRFPRSWVGLLSAAVGLGLVLDLAGWWLARGSAGFTPMIVAGGAAYGLGCALLVLLALAELWLPLRERRR